MEAYHMHLAVLYHYHYLLTVSATQLVLKCIVALGD